MSFNGFFVTLFCSGKSPWCVLQWHLLAFGWSLLSVYDREFGEPLFIAVPEIKSYLICLKSFLELILPTSSFQSFLIQT